jgi:glycosyltransferase involved in cell wall biosynthesis
MKASHQQVKDVVGVPDYDVTLWNSRSHDYVLLIPVINEGDKLLRQLRDMTQHRLDIDVAIVDGGSEDGSTDIEVLMSFCVSARIQCHKGLSRQMRAGMHWALAQGYKGVLFIDGNGKDSWWDVPRFIEALEAGFGHVQGSRYIAGGKAINTPWDRHLAVTLLHAPLISLAAGCRYTDTTNGFRGYSAQYLQDPLVKPFRDIFETYNLHYYLAIRAPRLSYKIKEVPVTRRYPDHGKLPTKISGVKGKFHVLGQLFKASLGMYNP